MKFVSWSISLWSGTSGGTLAPLFTIGSGLGALIGAGAKYLLPAAAVDLRIAALVGMAAIFAGASRALLASVVFAFETTLQPLGLLPLLGGCTASFLVSCLLMRHSIMTEKIARRGVRVPTEYAADFLDTIHVREMASKGVVSLAADDTIQTVRAWINSHAPGTTHQGFPLVDGLGNLVGVLTRRDLLDPAIDPSTILRAMLKRPPSIVYADCSLRDAADHMVNHNIGRLPVIERNTGRLIGMITRSDLLSAHRRRLQKMRRTGPMRWKRASEISSPR
jgi:CBS domain-containing protein